MPLPPTYDPEKIREDQRQAANGFLEREEETPPPPSPPPPPVHSHFCISIKTPRPQQEGPGLERTVRQIARNLGLKVNLVFSALQPRHEGMVAVLVGEESFIVAQEYPERLATEFDITAACERPDTALQQAVAAIRRAYPPDSALSAIMLVGRSHYSHSAP